MVQNVIKIGEKNMVINKLFCQGNIIASIIIFLGLSFFLNIMPAAEPIIVPEETEYVGVKIDAGPDYDAAHYLISFYDNNDKEILDQEFYGDTVTRSLPVQGLTMKVWAYKGEIAYKADEKNFTASDIMGLAILYIGKNGEITVLPKIQQLPLETRPAATPMKEITIEPSRDYKGLKTYRIEFKNTSATRSVATQAQVSSPTSSQHRSLPVSSLLVIVKLLPTNIRTDSREFTADEIARLKTIYISHNGIIEPVFESTTRQQITPPAAKPFEVGPGAKFKTITVDGSWDYKGVVRIDFKDASGNEAARSVVIGESGKSILLPVRKLEVIVTSLKTNKRIDARAFNVDEIAQLKTLYISKNGVIEAIFESKQQIAPQAVAKPSGELPIVSITSRYFQAIDQGDIQRLRAILPDVIKAGDVDRQDKQGISALGRIIMRLKNDLDMIQELRTSGVNLFPNNPAVQSQIGLAGDRQADILKILCGLGECPVCFQEEKPLEILSCGHAICRECLKQIMARGGGCPVCRQPIKQ